MSAFVRLLDKFTIVVAWLEFTINRDQLMLQTIVLQHIRSLIVVIYS